MEQRENKGKTQSEVAFYINEGTHNQVVLNPR